MPNLSLPLLFWTSGPQSRWIFTWRVTWTEALLNCWFVRVILWFSWMNVDMSALLKQLHSAFDMRSFRSHFNQFSLRETGCTHWINRHYGLGEVPVFPIFSFFSHFLSSSYASSSFISHHHQLPHNHSIATVALCRCWMKHPVPWHHWCQSVWNLFQDWISHHIDSKVASIQVVKDNQNHPLQSTGVPEIVHSQGIVDFIS